MKQTFTKFTFLGTLLFVSGLMYGQDLYILQVDGQDNNFVTVSAAFGPCIQQQDISGELVLAAPLNGCADLTNGADVSGKIAVIDRGSCDFIEKARNAQNAGAIAAIICNNQPTSSPNGGLINMGVGDGQIDDITIPSYSVTQEDCALFRTSIPVMANITPPEFGEAEPEKVLWGDQPGQGDFDGGLNGWSVVTLECNGAASEVDTWTYEEDGIAEGSLSNGFAPGPSFCNGAMAFNSDFLDNAGNGVDEAGNILMENFGTGPCPAPQFGELIS
ncbi:MAG: PA domain-containing protein, partial [Bacteroidota bacterium]